MTPKPYYQDDSVTIYHGDSLEIIGDLQIEPSLVATDPPYFRVVDEAWDDQWGSDFDSFLDFIGQALDASKAKLIERGTVAIFCASDYSSFVEMEVRRRFAFLNHIVWRKPIGKLGRMDKSTLRRFFPTSERIIIAEMAKNPDGDLMRFTQNVNYEVARHVYAELREKLCRWRDEAGLKGTEVDKALGTVGMAGHYFGASQWTLPTREAWAVISRMMKERGVVVEEFDSLREEFDSRRGEFDSRRREFDSRRDDNVHDLELLSDVWTFSPPLGAKRTKHATQKPLSIMEHLIYTLSREGDTVLDLFMGSGTTLVAAKKTGRKAVGIEMNESYCEIAADRCRQGVLPL